MSSETPKMTYVPGRGMGELSRLIFAVNDVEIKEEYIYTKHEFENLKATGKLMFLQLPLVEVDGLCLIESVAHGNYLGHKYGMLGGTDKERAMVLMLFAGARSLWASCGPNWQWHPPEKKEEIVKGIVKNAKNRYLPAFEKALENNGTGFLVGSSPTIADCAFFDILSYNEMPEYGDLLADFPHCKAFLTKFAEIPGVKKYLNGPRRFPPPDEAYIKLVREALNI